MKWQNRILFTDQFLCMQPILTSTIFVRLANGLKNNAMDLCDNNNSNAFTKRIPCIVLMSPGSLVTLTNDLPFFINEKAVNKSSEMYCITRRFLLLTFNSTYAVCLLTVPLQLKLWRLKRLLQRSTYN